MGKIQGVFHYYLLFRLLNTMFDVYKRGCTYACTPITLNLSISSPFLHYCAKKICIKANRDPVIETHESAKRKEKHDIIQK